MKRTLFIIVFLAGILPLSHTFVSGNDKRIRDSIFQAANALPQDTLCTQYLRNAFQQYIGRETATEYLDSALALSIRKNLQEEELWTLFDYCRHYEYRCDLPNLEKQFKRLKEASYRHKNYPYYYSIWLSILQRKCSQGDTEYAIMQAKQMKEEAISVKDKNGVFVSNLALAQAYDYAGQNDLAAVAYKQALKENPKANDVSLEVIHGQLSKIYLKQKKYSQALHELQQQESLLKKMALLAPESDTYKASLLELEINFCKIYMALGKLELLNKHLQNAKGYYHTDTYAGAYIDYHALWGSYYMFTKEWDKCFLEFNLALAACQGAEPFHENEILKIYADALMESAHYEEAALAYKKAAIRGDSLTNNMLQLHKEAHQANFKIHDALLKKEQLTKRNRYIQVGAATFILILLLGSIIRAIYIRRQLLRSEEKTRAAFETIKSADKMKERFLHNITHQIRIPLNNVVGFSELLSAEKGLTDEDLEEYSTVVKNSAEKLLSLINNILDLSRLEAGMMRFDVQENDIVQLCGEAAMTVNKQTPQTAEATFTTNLETLPLAVDSRWFLKLLVTLLSAPKGYKGEMLQTKFTLSRTDTQLKIIIKGSPLYYCWEDEQEQHILHDINRLYVETFKGSYLVLRERGSNERPVSISFPLN